MESHRLTPFDLFLPQNELLQPLSQRFKTRQLTSIEWRRKESFSEKPKRPRLLKIATAQTSESTALKPIRQGTLPSLVTMGVLISQDGTQCQQLFLQLSEQDSNVRFVQSRIVLFMSGKRRRTEGWSCA